MFYKYKLYVMCALFSIAFIMKAPDGAPRVGEVGVGEGKDFVSTHDLTPGQQHDMHAWHQRENQMRVWEGKGKVSVEELKDMRDKLYQKNKENPVVVTDTETVRLEAKPDAQPKKEPAETKKAESVDYDKMLEPLDNPAMQQKVVERYRELLTQHNKMHMSKAMDRSFSLRKQNMFEGEGSLDSLDRIIQSAHDFKLMNSFSGDYAKLFRLARKRGESVPAEKDLTKADVDKAFKKEMADIDKNVLNGTAEYEDAVSNKVNLIIQRDSLLRELGHSIELSTTEDVSAKSAAQQKELNDQLLNAAGSKGDYEQIKSLIARGADVNAKNKKGDTVLHEVIEHRDDIESVKYLLEKGARVDARNNGGETVLHYAAVTGSPEIVKILIDKGADVNAKDKWGGTVLHYAVDFDHHEIVKHLLDAGADLLSYF